MPAPEDDRGRDRPRAGDEWRRQRDERDVLGRVGVAAGEVCAAQHLEGHEHQQQPAGDRQRAEGDAEVAEDQLAEDRKADDQRAGRGDRAECRRLALLRRQLAGDRQEDRRVPDRIRDHEQRHERLAEGAPVHAAPNNGSKGSSATISTGTGERKLSRRSSRSVCSTGTPRGLTR